MNSKIKNIILTLTFLLLGSVFSAASAQKIEVSGKVIDNTFSAGHKIEEVRVETRKYQYLFKILY